ncbi:hypothetical protein [Micromonospora cathayae]|uniref:BNR repeat-containing family member n=1 Tax=Micromonospora cathayae TaxID=3028804 RepID=A0ABY7ZIF4_9ACTN|nr:hypothetical protein [Micromonospora sp. HUAS 3]WDZ82665.1 hypothetical protein PVK37_19550 [Micromonospora sp. HUAS 3]
MSANRITARVAAAAVAAIVATTAAPHPVAGMPTGRTGAVQVSVVSDSLRVTNVVPTWGAQIPKVVYDGRWFYAATLDGDGTQYPWSARVWKSPDSRTWTEVVALPGHVYQPVGLLVDGAGRLHLQVACFTGAACYPGVAPAPGADLAGVYAVRLTFADRLADGSVDPGRFTDHTARSATPAGAGPERYYQGLAMSRDGRYLYTAYAVDNWDLHVNVFDTRTGTDVHTTRVGSPPPGRAWLYPRVQPGVAPGEVYLSFSQYVLGTPNSAYLDGATLWHSTDFGRTFGSRTYLTENPMPDGDGNWVDAADITVDAAGEVHAVFYRRDRGVGTLYYQRGLAGTPVAVGPLDNHSQLLVRPDGTRMVFTSSGASLVVAHSHDGVRWTISRHPVEGVASVLWPNLLQARSGSRTPPGYHAPGRPATGMLMAGQSAGQSAFQPLLYVRFR